MEPDETLPDYPTAEHARAAERIVAFFREQPEVEAILLTNSCARGKASRDSCLDIAIAVRPELSKLGRENLEARWKTLYTEEPVFTALLQVGYYSHVDLEIMDGNFAPPYHGHTSGPDEFELEIGNYIVYNVPLWERSGYWQTRRAVWLPYYADTLRQERLAMVRHYCLNNLRHIPLYVDRGLHFQAFNRLYHAFGEFLQAMFIARRTYPIAYDKWIREQIVEILELPDLYPQLVRLFEIRQFESGELTKKAQRVEAWLEEYASAG